MSVWHAFALQQQVPVTHFAGIVSTVVLVWLCLHTRIKLYETDTTESAKTGNLATPQLHSDG